MRKFDYRSPRYSVDFPVRLTLDEAMYIARCIEISTEGMKLEIDQPFQCGATGTVRFSEPRTAADLPVRICYSGPNYAGLKFLYESDSQREEIIQLLSLTGRRFHSAHLAHF